MVIRTYETAGRTARCRLEAGRLGSELSIANLMERQEKPTDGSCTYRPFDIVTYMVR